MRSVGPHPTRWSSRWPALPAVSVPTHLAAAPQCRQPSGRHLRFLDAHRSLISSSMRRKGYPSRPRAMTFCRFSWAQDIAHCRRRRQHRNQCPRTLFSLAGFSVTLIGRFWVTPEAFDAQPADLPPVDLMDMGLAIRRSLSRTVGLISDSCLPARVFAPRLFQARLAARYLSLALCQ